MSNRGEGGLGIILTIVALAAIGGFMYWLNLQSREIEAIRAEEDAAALEAARDLDASDLLQDPTGALNRRVVVPSVLVATGLGEGAFAIQLASDVAFPVLLEPDPIQILRMTETTIYGGDRVFVSGQVYTFNDSIAGVWVESGAVMETMSEMIPVSPTFLLADSVYVH